MRYNLTAAVFPRICSEVFSLVVPSVSWRVSLLFRVGTRHNVMSLETQTVTKRQITQVNKTLWSSIEVLLLSHYLNIVCTLVEMHVKGILRIGMKRMYTPQCQRPLVCLLALLSLWLKIYWRFVFWTISLNFQIRNTVPPPPLPLWSLYNVTWKQLEFTCAFVNRMTSRPSVHVILT